ncbi:hypothetical protein [Streptomyces sp. NPDC049949]|uniref:hypothetical protein n=1 Tax=Streptomyces sp. NPDC049949 TaxID=3154627 RepID=UPI003436613B
MDGTALGQFVAVVPDPHQGLALEEEEHLVFAGVEVEGRGLALGDVEPSDGGLSLGGLACRAGS